MRSTAKNIIRPASDIATRVDAIDWAQATSELDAQGCAVLKGLLSPDECRVLSALYPDDKHFRSRIVMGRHGFGRGEYKYFANPLPTLVQELRTHLYPPLAALANQWMDALRMPDRFPAELSTFLAYCHEHGQTRPTPLLLRYEQEGYNCLHQDLYGEIVFPLQLTCFLSKPGQDYTGGEFLLVEQQPRAQSRGAAILPQQGEMIIFTTRFRPAKGKRGYYRSQMRHGVSRITSGSRYTLGIIFHDAK